MSKGSVIERFSKKAINVIMLAQEEARRLGHSEVSDELLLLGLIGEQTGAAAQLLQSKGVNLQAAHRLVESVIGIGSGQVLAEVPFSPTVKQVLQHSLERARQQDSHWSVNTEHLLIGLLQDRSGGAVRVLETLGIDWQNLTDTLLQIRSSSDSSGDNPEEEIVVRSGDITTCDAIANRLATSLLAWVEPRQLGYVATRSLKLKHKSGKVLLPDVSFVSQERQKQLVSQTTSQLVPDLVAVVKDWGTVLKADFGLFFRMGVRVAVLIDLPRHRVRLWRSLSPSELQRYLSPSGLTSDQHQTMTNFPQSLQSQDKIVLRHYVHFEGTLELPELLPGWELPVSELWAALL